MEKLAENYWGTSEIEHVIDDLKKRDNVSWNIALLTFMANIRVLKMDGMENILSFASDKAQTELYNTVQGMNMLLNNNALQLLGKDDDYQQHQYAFSGLGDVYDRFMMDISGACGIPVTKLFGRSPAGLNSTGESDMQNYYDLIESNQEAQLRPVLEKILPIICVSALGEIPNDLDFVFNPVRRSNDNEKQDLGSQQTAAVTAAFTAGLISQKTALQELQQSSKRTGMWTNITDDDIAAADDIVIGVGEDIPVPSLAVTDADFKEEQHPRDKEGKFSSQENGRNNNKKEFYKFSDKSYNEAIKGIRVSVTDIVISGITRHAMNRLRERSIFPKTLKRVLTDGEIKQYKNEENILNVTTESYRIGVDKTTGNVVTAIYIKKDKRREKKK